MLKTTMAPPYLVEGTVQIQVAAAEPTQCVVLHAVGMNVTAVQLLVPTDTEEDEVVEGEGQVRQGRSIKRVRAGPCLQRCCSCPRGKQKAMFEQCHILCMHSFVAFVLLERPCTLHK